MSDVSDTLKPQPTNGGESGLCCKIKVEHNLKSCLHRITAQILGAMKNVVNRLHIGPKGSVCIILNRENYVAGDMVQGQVVLRVSRFIECKMLSMHVTGVETVKWSEGSTHTLAPCCLRDTFLCEEIQLDHSVPCAFKPGEYRFQFCYQLNEMLPPVFCKTKTSVGALRDINTSISYTINAQLRLSGNRVADLHTSRNIIVHRPLLCHIVRSLQKSSSDEVRSLIFLKSKGLCEIQVCLDSDVQISGMRLSLRAQISNFSVRDMHSLSVQLYEDVFVQLPNRRLNKGTRVVCKRVYPGVNAGQLLVKTLSLPLIDDESGKPIAPTHSATFIRWQYRLKVKCRFMLSKSVKVEMPVTILRNIGAPPASVVGVSGSPAVIVVVPEDDRAERNIHSGLVLVP